MSEAVTPTPTQPGGLAFHPKPIASIEQTGLGILWLQDLTLKTLYYTGVMTGFALSEALCLPFSGVTDADIIGTQEREIC